MASVRSRWARDEEGVPQAARQRAGRGSPFPRAEFAAASALQVWKIKSNLVEICSCFSLCKLGRLQGRPSGLLSLLGAFLQPQSVILLLLELRLPASTVLAVCPPLQRLPFTALLDSSLMILGWSPIACSASAGSQLVGGSGDALASCPGVLHRAQAACVMLRRCLLGSPCGSK